MDKLWLKNYLPSIPEKIDVSQYGSLVDLFKKSCYRFADKPAFTQMGFTLSYRDLDEQTRQFAAYLQDGLKLKKSDKIALMLPNSFQFVIAFFGALRLGLVVVSINPLDTPRELEFQLNDSKAQAIVVLNQFLPVVEDVFTQTEIRHIIVTEFGDIFPFFKRLLINIALKIKAYRKRSRASKKAWVPSFTPKTEGLLENRIKFRSVLRGGKRLDYLDPEITSQDLALLQYTGGTTGTPKAAMLTHRNMSANVVQCITYVRPALSIGKERIVVALPLYHIFSLTVCCLSFLSIGGLGILIPDPRAIRSFVKVLKKEKPTVLAGVNTLFNALLNQPSFSSLEFSDLHLTISGGMKLQKKVADRWQEKTRKVIIEGYGLTEASPVVCVNPVDLKKFNGSIGFPLPSTEISIRDESGKEVEVGKTGELWVRGPQVMKGYWEHPKGTEEVLTPEGWLKTGDIAYMDEEGFIYLVDRKKELIIVSGFNVYPSEIEKVLNAYPGVVESAVVGIPNALSGEVVKAYVVKKSPDLTAQELMNYCKKNLLPYKIPRKVEFMDALPKSPVGKVLKRELKK